MTSRTKNYLIYVGVAIGLVVFGFVLLQFILAAYSSAVTWTGFTDYTSPNGDFVRGKTLWDWMELLIIPFFLAGGVFFLNRAERINEREIATDRQHEAALQSYLDRMADLLVKDHLLTTKSEDVRNV